MFPPDTFQLGKLRHRGWAHSLTSSEWQSGGPNPSGLSLLPTTRPGLGAPSAPPPPAAPEVTRPQNSSRTEPVCDAAVTRGEGRSFPRDGRPPATPGPGATALRGAAASCLRRFSMCVFSSCRRTRGAHTSPPASSPALRSCRTRLGPTAAIPCRWTLGSAPFFPCLAQCRGEPACPHPQAREGAPVSPALSTPRGGGLFSRSLWAC